MNDISNQQNIINNDISNQECVPVGSKRKTTAKVKARGRRTNIGLIIRSLLILGLFRVIIQEIPFTVNPFPFTILNSGPPSNIKLTTNKLD